MPVDMTHSLPWSSFVFFFRYTSASYANKYSNCTKNNEANRHTDPVHPPFIG
jgi:hypothetical protein